MSDESDNYPRSPYIQDLFIISKLEHQGRPNGKVGVILVNGGQLTKLHRRFPVELLLSLDWSLIADFRKEVIGCAESIIARSSTGKRCPGSP